MKPRHRKWDFEAVPHPTKILSDLAVSPAASNMSSSATADSSSSSSLLNNSCDVGGSTETLHNGASNSAALTCQNTLVRNHIN